MQIQVYECGEERGCLNGKPGNQAIYKNKHFFLCYVERCIRFSSTHAGYRNHIKCVEIVVSVNYYRVANMLSYVQSVAAQ